MIDLRASPFFLSEESITWVQGALSSMTPEEKNRTIVLHHCRWRESPDPGRAGPTVSAWRVYVPLGSGRSSISGLPGHG